MIIDMKPRPADFAKSPQFALLLRILALLLTNGALVWLGSSLLVDAPTIFGQIFGLLLIIATILVLFYVCRQFRIDWCYFTILISLLLGLSGINLIYRIVENHRLDATSVSLQDDLTANFGSEVKISDFLINLQGELIEDSTLPTTELGPRQVSFEYVNQKGRRRTSSFTIEIVDRTAPQIYGSSSYTVYRGYDGDLTNLMLSGDNLDDHPHREILGEYDLSTIGSYPLTYRITDASGNQTTQDFTLHVVDPSINTNLPILDTPRLPLSDVIAQHKTARTKIGIDVSAWQGNIDWPRAKAAGVEFAFIRLGYQVDYGGEYVLDRYFEANLTRATAVGIPAGVYFYSYADSISEAAAQAHWVVDQLAGRQVELGIAFDWEDWTNFNQTGMSFYTLNQVANHYLDTVTAAGYQGSLYGSRNYLTRIWQPEKYPVWLAQYYDFVTYDRAYWIWQMSASGQVPGINGNVDLDIMYLD